MPWDVLSLDQLRSVTGTPLGTPPPTTSAGRRPCTFCAWPYSRS